MDIRKKIEKIKNQMKTAGMVAAFGTMTLNSSAQNVTQDIKENKIETVEKTNKFSEYYCEAIENNNIENVKHLIASGKDFNVSETIERDDGTYTYPPAIFMAATNRKLDIADILLQEGANPNQKLDHGETPAFWTYSVEMLQLLEKYGADLNAKDNNGNQALHGLSGDSTVMHSSQWNTEVAELLVEKGNSLDNLKNFDPTDPERTKFCVEKGVDFDMDYAVGTAVNIGTYEDLKILLKNGGAKSINIQEEGSQYSSPFESAIFSMLCDEEAIRWAKENGDAQDIKSHEEDWNESKKMAELMISYGADFSNVSEMMNRGNGVEGHPETNKFVKQAEASQAQLNKMKQIQGR